MNESFSHTHTLSLSDSSGYTVTPVSEKTQHSARGAH